MNILETVVTLPEKDPETNKDAAPVKPEESAPPIEATPANLVAEPLDTPVEVPPDQGKQPASIFPEITQTDPGKPNAEETQPGDGRTARKTSTVAHYAAFDWRKPNNVIADHFRVSRQRIQQLRKQMFPDGIPVDYIPGQIVESDKPSFEDLNESQQAMPPVQPIPDRYHETAEMMFDIPIMALSKGFGPEWMPQPGQQGMKGERDNMVDAIEKYLRTKEIPDIPPGVMLCLMVALYSAPRLKAPSTSNKLKMGWYWLKNKFSRKKQPKQPNLNGI